MGAKESLRAFLTFALVGVSGLFHAREEAFGSWRGPGFPLDQVVKRKTSLSLAGNQTQPIPPVEWGTVLTEII
jgi:hypothetical protein